MRLGHSEGWKRLKVGVCTRALTRRHLGPFSVILGPLGVPPEAGPWNGHSGAWSTLAAVTLAFGVPKMIVCRPNTMPDSVVTFFLGARKGP